MSVALQSRRRVWLAFGAGIAVLCVVATYVWAGGYDVAADAPHWRMTTPLLEAMRAHSIRTRVSTIVAPDLANAELISRGAKHYAEMCVGCHLAPRVTDSELRAGLYPRPPNLAAANHRDRAQYLGRSPAEQFWIIKHGPKMTAMLAWGTTHDDRATGSVVTFVRQLPQLDTVQYRAMVGESAPLREHGHGEGPASHDHEAGHDHGHE